MPRTDLARVCCSAASSSGTRSRRHARESFVRIAVLTGGPARGRCSAEHIGAKAASLAQMATLGLLVPPAFVLPVELCAAIIRQDADCRKSLTAGLAEGIAFLESITDNRLGDHRRPMLLSVRSGAARSMLGMLDTVLNVGCTMAAVRGLVRATGNPKFAWDCRRRFLESYGSVVLRIDAASFDRQLRDFRAAERVSEEEALDGEALERLAMGYGQFIEEAASLLEDPVAQLEAAARPCTSHGPANAHPPIGHSSTSNGCPVLL